MSSLLGYLRTVKHQAVHAPATLCRALADPNNVVLMTPDGIGLGNFAYFWLQVTIQRSRGVSCHAVRTRPMQQWLDVFPAVNDLLIERSAVARRATKEHHFWQAWGESYDRDQLHDFTRRYLLSSQLFNETMSQYASGDDTVVINIRRGDYYSVPKFRGWYSFDVVEYVAIALERCLATRSVENITVVSDDPAWCQTKLNWLEEIAPVHYPVPGEPPATNLARLASASRLILANSTFSYWGGHLAGTRNSDVHIIAPWFHSRDHLDGAAYQLDPAWDIVEEIPGGWDG